MQWERDQDILFSDESHNIFQTVFQTICFPSSLPELHHSMVVVTDSVPLMTSGCALILGSRRKLESSKMRPQFNKR